MNLSIMNGILNYLLTHNKTSAQELANEFEVNQRTIYRYIDNLTFQDIPITTLRGKNGGILIDKKYKVEKQIFTNNELEYLINMLKKDQTEMSSQILKKFNLF